MNSIDRLLVTNTAAEGVAGVRGVRDQPPVPDNLDDLLDAPRLRIGRMNFDEFGHARIVG